MTKVLLVEDDNNLREIYEARLAAEGYDISTAKDGEDALAVAKQVKPDLIISDVMMPRISGFEMLDILRNTDGLKHTRIIMLTALGQAEDKTRADSLGADRYLVKSQVTLEDIVKAAQELLDPDSQEDPATAIEAAQSEANNFSPTAPPDIAAVAHQSQADAAQATQPAPTLSSLEVSNNPEAVVNAAMPDTSQPVQPAPVDAADTPQQPAAVPTTDQTPVADVAPAPTVDPVAAPAAQPITTPLPPATTDADDTPLIQMPPQPDEVNAAAVVTNNEALSASQENTAVTQQIENFVNTELPATTPEVQPMEPTTSAIEQPVAPIAPTAPLPDSQVPPAPMPAPTEPLAPAPQSTLADPAPNATNDAINDQTLQTAVDNLTNATDPAMQPPNNTQSIGKKVIQPISDPSTETNQLETLLAQEEMQANLATGVTGSPIIGNVAEPVTDQSPPQAPPIEIPQLPVQPAPSSVFTPNTDGTADEHAL